MRTWLHCSANRLPYSARRHRALMLLLLVGILLLSPTRLSATFSIVAVDTVTGTVGSAGSSCIAGSKIIHDVVEGLGAINTQAFYNATNQSNAHALLLSGWDPDSILGWLQTHDAANQPQIRQYGVVTLAGGGASGSFTGANNTVWAGHRTGPGYAIQGNILLGPEIVDSMEAAFLSTPGPLEERLMAAIEAADVPGADTRCLACNKPTISAYIKVIRIGDGATPYLYTFIDNTDCATNPLPILRAQYDAWRALQQADADSSLVTITKMALLSGGNDSTEIAVTPRNYTGAAPNEGVNSVAISNSGGGVLSPVTDNGSGTYSAWLWSAPTFGSDDLTILVDAGGTVIELTAHPHVQYYLAGDADGNGLITISDAVFLIGYIFGGGSAPDPLLAGDADCNGIVTISDAVFLIQYIFGGGAAPCG